jgi:hypothetical protein
VCNAPPAVAKSAQKKRADERQRAKKGVKKQAGKIFYFPALKFLRFVPIK